MKHLKFLATALILTSSMVASAVCSQQVKAGRNADTSFKKVAATQVVQDTKTVKGSK